MGFHLRQQSYETITHQYKKQYIELLHEIGEEFLLPKGKLMRQKDLYYLIDGKCALCIHGDAGEELSLIYFYPGRLLNFLPCLTRFYPLQPLLDKRRVPLHSFVIRAVCNCRFLRIPHDVFLEKYFHSLPLHSLIVQSLVENTYSLFSHAFNSPMLPTGQRICRLLLEIMDDEPPHYLQRITYAEISSHLSIHFVTVAKVFKALRQAEIIRKQPGGISVIRPEQLRRFAEGREHLPYKTKTIR